MTKCAASDLAAHPVCYQLAAAVITCLPDSLAMLFILLTVLTVSQPHHAVRRAIVQAALLLQGAVYGLVCHALC